MWPSGWKLSSDLRGPIGVSIVAAGVFILVSGIGAATSYLSASLEASGPSPSASNGDTVSRLEDYTRAIGAKETAPKAPAGKLLPDVNTMIERLATRLEATPGDVKGWRALGWSYFSTGRYEEAISAYGKAVELDPNSQELKFELEEVKAKASESQSLAAAPHAQMAATDGGNAGPSAEQMASIQAMPPQERAAAIRSMVDSLANRLESSPRDVEGWARLMRSRVVLGEKEVAATALRKALDVFKDDAAASGRITAAAAELGLKVE